MNTLERKKIKGGKYEYYIADDDGNILEEIPIEKILKTIKMYNESIDLFEDEKQQLVIKKVIDDLLTLTTLIIEFNPIKET